VTNVELGGRRFALLPMCRPQVSLGQNLIRRETVGSSDDIVQKVWEKGRIVPGNDPNVWRQDECEAWIGRKEYGNRNSQYGWEIDHITPGGSDLLFNLRPLQWENNVDKSSGRLKCNVTASGKENVRR